jgi:uncharacterized phage protein (TIGR02220 family)
MARARNIKPAFFMNEYLGTADIHEMVLFEGLWCLADKSGRLENRPLKIAAQIFPYRGFSAQVISGMIRNLSSNGFLVEYEIDGEQFIEITNFVKHQNPHRNEKPSEIPNPKEGSVKTTACEDSGNYASNPDNFGSARADSLIPDSLIPDSGYLIPDPIELPCPAKAERHGEARSNLPAEIIAHLNEKANRNFRVVPANSKLILDRAKEGATVDDFKAVIDRKCAEWAKDPKMSQYLRPATLFNAQKFNNYIGQIEAPLPASTGVVHHLQSVPASREQRIHDQNVEVGRQWAARRRAQGE